MTQDQRMNLLQKLDGVVNSLETFVLTCENLSSLRVDEWTGKQVLMHLTFWHESFARNVCDLARLKKPQPVRGTYAALNQKAFTEMDGLNHQEIWERFSGAHRLIRKHILNPNINSIPYKSGSRDYSTEEQLEIVSGHILDHLKEMKKAVEDDLRN